MADARPAAATGHERAAGGSSPERTLVLLRHAKSDWSGDEPDICRPLAARGVRQAPEAGRWLAEHLPRIDLAVVSPASRARATWDLVSARLGGTPSTRVDDRLYGASVEDLVSVVRELPEALHTVVLVGHNPALEDLVTELTGDRVAMPTAAVAVIAVPGSWSSAGQVPAALAACGRPPSGGKRR